MDRGQLGKGRASGIVLVLIVLSLAGCSSGGGTSYWQEGGIAAYARCQQWLDAGQEPAYQWIASGRQLLMFDNEQILCEPDPSRRVARAWLAAARKEATHQMIESQIGPFNSVEFLPLTAP